MQFRPDDWSDWKSLPSGTDVSTGMRLRTGNDGAVAMQLKSNDQLYLDQDSEVLLRGDGVQLEQGRLKVRCASNETPRVVLRLGII